MNQEKKNKSVKCSDEVEELLKRFHPQFGNPNHIEITVLYRQIQKLLVLIQEGGRKKQELSRLTRATKERIKEVKKKESLLISLLSKEVTAMK